MQTSKNIYVLLKVFFLASVMLQYGCATQYVADTDADQLVAAIQDLPKVQPYFATANFYPELNNKSGKAEANNADSRNLKPIIYSEDEMLNLAAHASIFRWFQNDNGKDDAPVLNIHARIYKLDHSLKVEKGHMRPIAMTKLEVFLTDSEKNRIYESFFSANAEGKLIKRFRNKRETQDMYGYTIYKALALAFELAFADITDTLNLKPTYFDVDNIELENIDVIDKTSENDKDSEDIKNLEDALVKDTKT